MTINKLQSDIPQYLHYTETWLSKKLVSKTYTGGCRGTQAVNLCVKPQNYNMI